MRDAVEAEFARREDDGITLPESEVARIRAYFAAPDLKARRPAFGRASKIGARAIAAFAAFIETNVAEHKVAGHGIVTISLKPIGLIPGDCNAEQMEAVSRPRGALLARRAACVARAESRAAACRARRPAGGLRRVGGAEPRDAQHVGLVSDIIACPGLDYCALATARSIPVAQRISDRFGAGERAREIGPLKIKISGCINACGHHHVGHIGILGLERKGVETYQLTLGGSGDETCSIGDITGPGFSSENVVDAVETLVDAYIGLRQTKDESFLAAYRRVGMAPFKKALYERDAAADI